MMDVYFSCPCYELRRFCGARCSCAHCVPACRFIGYTAYCWRALRRLMPR